MRQFLITVAAILGTTSLMAQESERLYLSGTDKDHTRTWEFFCTGGMNSGRWTTIEVPSCWELQGFGTYNYGHDRPHADEQGRYRYTFKVPSSMKGRTVYLVFDGKTIATETDIIDLATGRQVATLKGDTTVSGHVGGVKPWSPETPWRYEAVVRLMKGRKPLHVYRQRFGFRTIEFRERDGFYLNGQRVMFKGVCRHTFWPESGRTSSPALAIEDVNLIKDMNMNAVRMSHYPPDEYFLDTCDSLGLMVIDELAGWQKQYDTDVARRLVCAMIERDVNHPSIMIWANSNEGGFNKDIRSDYTMLDPQRRKVVEPGRTAEPQGPLRPCRHSRHRLLRRRIESHLTQ